MPSSAAPQPKKAPPASVPNPPYSAHHIESLDGIRGVAILLVLADHFRLTQLVPEQYRPIHLLSDAASFGWFGVDLFFALSGFLITGILLDTSAAPNRARSFYGRRMLRIFPLYYAVLLLVLLLGSLLRSHVWSLAQAWPSNTAWVFYFLYGQNWWITLKERQHMALLGHLWSLAVEEQFYLVWPWCVWFLSRAKLRWICAAGVAAALLLRWQLASVNYSHFDWFIYEGTLPRMDTLLAGAFAALAVRDAHLRLRLRSALPYIAAASAISFAVLVIYTHEVNGAGYTTEVYGHSLTAIFAGCLVLAAAFYSTSASPPMRILNSRILRRFGRYSYGIYVYQSFILFAALVAFSRYTWWKPSLLFSGLALLLWVTVPFFVAMLSFRYFEQPFLRLKTRFRALPRAAPAPNP